MTGFEIFMVISTILSTAASTMQAQRQRRAQEKAAQQAADAAAKDRWDAYEKAEKERKDRLKKVLAQKRAKMGASGFSAADGSAGAIVQGLRTDAAEQTAEDYDNAKDSVNQTMSGIQSSLLEKSRQTDRQIYGQIGQAATTIGGTLLAPAKPEEVATATI